MTFVTVGSSPACSIIADVSKYLWRSPLQPTKHTALARWMLVFALVFMTGTALADTRLLRFPDVHGNQVVFSYGGDLWAAPTTGGTAWRLTSHPGLELRSEEHTSELQSRGHLV